MKDLKKPNRLSKADSGKIAIGSDKRLMLLIDEVEKGLADIEAGRVIDAKAFLKRINGRNTFSM